MDSNTDYEDCSLYQTLLEKISKHQLGDHISNQELYGGLPQLSLTIQQRRLRFAGHCIRADNQPISKFLF